MSRIKDFYNKYLAKINAYWLVIIVFLVLTLTLGDSSLYKRYTYDQKIRSLEKEIKHYQKEIEINSKKLNDLHTDKEGLERFAREEYFMKKPNEDTHHRFQSLRPASARRCGTLFALACCCALPVRSRGCRLCRLPPDYFRKGNGASPP